MVRVLLAHMRRPLVTAATVAALTLTPDAGAKAHPHVWVDTAVTYVFTDGQVTALEFDWLFDPFFTAVILTDFDADQDGSLDAAERRNAAETIAESLKAGNYFAHISLDGGAELQVGAVEDFVVELRSDGRAAVRFLIPLDAPAAPASLAVAVYDESNYVSFLYDEVDPVRYRGEGSFGCLPQLLEDPDNSYYFGLVTPQRIELLCAAS